MRVPFLDLKTQYNSIRGEIAEAVDRVLESTQYILGPEVVAFEEAFASAHNAPHCVTSNNGTSALHLALWALGIKSGDEVIVPVNTFIATAEAVALCGATPVFADHDKYYALDEDQVERKITSRTRAIMAVHLYGQPANMPALAYIANRHGLKLVEDAAQAHIASLDGKPVGSWGDATGFSFYPGKNLGAYGEGGAVITRNASLDQQMRRLRDHGSEGKYRHVALGHNYRLEAIQAAILNVKLKYLQQWTEQRQSRAEKYNELLKDIADVTTPLVRDGASHVYHLYVVQAERRDKLREYLEQNEISTGLHYPVPLHIQPCFANLGYKIGAFPNAEQAAGRLLSLPIYPELTNNQIEFVADKIRSFYKLEGAAATR